MKKVGIIGSGTMGTDVAHAFAEADYTVMVIDNNPNQFEKTKKKIKENLRFQKLYQTSQEKPQSYEYIMSRIQFSTEISSVSEFPYIIENATEDWGIKKGIHEKLEEVVSDSTIIAVNTSAIPVTRFGSLTKNPENVIGIHFMNPAHIMPTVEVIRGIRTSENTLNSTKDLLSSIRKKHIVVNDSPGFITNRAMMLFVNEAIFCLYEGVSTKENIDTLFKECFGHKMGPLQTGDLIGLDTILKSLEVLYQSFNDDKYRPCILLKQMVDAGYLGVKSGQGFYEYIN